MVVESIKIHFKSTSPKRLPKLATQIHLSDKGLALLDVLLELRQACLKESLLLSGERADGVDLLNTVGLHNNVSKVGDLG